MEKFSLREYPLKVFVKNFLDPEKFCGKIFLKRFCRFYGIFPEIFIVEKFSVKAFVDFPQIKACTDRTYSGFDRVQLKILSECECHPQKFLN